MYKLPIPNTFTEDDITYVSSLAMEEIPDDIAGMEAYAETLHSWSVWLIKPYAEARQEYDKVAMQVTTEEREKQKGIQATMLEILINGRFPDEVQQVRVLKSLVDAVSQKVDLCRTFIKTERERLERMPK